VERGCAEERSQEGKPALLYPGCTLEYSPAAGCLPDAPRVPPVQFHDILHFQTLFTSDWPATQISDEATWTSGKISKHSGEAEGMFGSFGIVDSAYSGTGTVGSLITLCAGTAGAVCRG
jgi:hypothetical protein